MNEKADASEALDYILKIIHSELHTNTVTATPCVCPVHLACHHKIYQEVRCSECKLEQRVYFDADFFIQNISCREILEFGPKIMSQKTKS